MVNAAREPLHGTIEVDDTWIGGPQPGLRGSRQLKGRRAALVLVAVEKRGRGTGRVRMGVIRDFKAATVTGLLTLSPRPETSRHQATIPTRHRDWSGLRAGHAWLCAIPPSSSPCPDAHRIANTLGGALPV